LHGHDLIAVIFACLVDSASQYGKGVVFFVVLE
jgi:hypothetical protein